MPRASERGAVAVEFALLAPVLIMLLLGIMEFGRAYHTQIVLSDAAREGARVMAINSSQSAAKAAAQRAAASLHPAVLDVKIGFTFHPAPATAPPGCPADSQVTVKIDYALTTMTGIAGPFALKGVGTMQCGG